VKYTYAGDANNDGGLDVDDYTAIDSGISAGLTGWSNGDFNYDGKLNIDDYVIIDSNLPTHGAPFANAATVTADSGEALTLARRPPPLTLRSGQWLMVEDREPTIDLLT
jgi:hypothetical protein